MLQPQIENKLNCNNNNTKNKKKQKLEEVCWTLSPVLVNALRCKVSFLVFFVIFGANCMQIRLVRNSETKAKSKKRKENNRKSPLMDFIFKFETNF